MINKNEWYRFSQNKGGYAIDIMKEFYGLSYAEAVKECLEDLIAVHDRAPYDLKIEHIDADGLTLTIFTTEPCPAIINYLGDPYGAIIDMDYGILLSGALSTNVPKTMRS